MKLEKQVTKKIINQSDRTADKIVINNINEKDDAVFCSIYEGEKQLAQNRVFTLRTLPCEPLNHGEIELVKGNTPTDKWYTEEIKLWLDSKQTSIEGEVSKKDSFYYSSSALKADLLEIANPKEMI